MELPFNSENPAFIRSIEQPRVPALTTVNNHRAAAARTVSYNTTRQLYSQYFK